MLDQKKVAEANASKTPAAGGPPGTKKVDTTNGVDQPKVKKQLAKLIGATVEVPSNDAPVQAVATKEGAPQKPSSKKAVRWLTKKLGEKGAEQMAKGNGVSLKKYALAMYTEHLAAKAKAPKNDAMDALTNGSKKRSAKKEAAEATARQKEIDGAMLKLKVSSNEALQSALRGFLDGPCKEVLDMFVALYVSRNMEHDSDEAVLALNACRKAFDACGLILTDVETKSKGAKGSTRTVAAAIARGELDPGSSETARLLEEEVKAKCAKPIRVAKPKPTVKEGRVRKEMTPAQREAKNKKDRDRRAAKSKK
jgi:hypothetical protein